MLAIFTFVFVENISPIAAVQDTVIKAKISKAPNLYIQCDNFSVYLENDHLVFYNKHGEKYFEHDEESLWFGNSIGGATGEKRCDVPISVHQNGKYGNIMPDGKLFAGRLFENSLSLNNNILAYAENEKWGLIDKTGQIIVVPQYDEIRWYKRGKFKVYHKDKIFLMDIAGRPENIQDDPNYIEKYDVTLPPREEYLACDDGLKYQARNGSWGLVNNEGKVEIPFNFRALICLDEGMVYAAIDNRQEWCPIDASGNIRPGEPCKPELYYSILSHYWPEKLADTKFESSVLWHKAWLGYGEGRISEPPKYVGDGYRGTSSILARPYR
jgi:hypothetical protein